MRRNPARPAYKPVTDTAASSAAFRRWFGASKVVDKRGKPLVVYHGAARGGFDTFRRQARRGIFFSDIPDVAWTYTHSDTDALAARTVSDRRRGKPALYEVYLRMEKPLVVDAMGSDWASVPVYGMPEAQREAVLNAVYPYASALSTDDLVAAARKLKYDGVIIKNVVDIGDYTDYDGTSTVYAIFDPKQVKSANMNVGTFDPRDPRITHNPSRRRNGVSEPHRSEKPDAVVMDPKRMARVFIENPRVTRRRNPAREETFLEGVERREKKKGKAERAVGKAQLAHGGAVLGMAVAKKAAPAAAVRLGATVGGRAIPIVGEVLMVVGAGKEAYKVGKRRLKGGGGSWKTDLAKVGAGAVGLEDFVPEADEAKKGESKTKKNPRRKAAPTARGTSTSRGTVFFDMDETLLHSVAGGRAGLPRIKVGPYYYGVAVRPDAMDALLEAAKHAHVNVLTTADRQYALKALDAVGLLGPGSPIRKVYSTREPEDVPPVQGPWVLLDNDPDSAAEKTQVLVGYNDFERVTIVPDFEALPRSAPDALLRGLKKALRKLASRN